jgi:hypothetical protein
MGMEQYVVFPTPEAPAWPAVADLLARAGLPVQMRMIDGELAFPDEAPPADWRELRIAAAGAMVTLRRAAAGFTVVAWGNADDAQQRLYNAAAWALARAGGGRVQAGGDSLDAESFARQALMPPGWASA